MSIYLPLHCRDDVINYSTWKSTHGIIARVDCDNNRKEDNDDNDVDIDSNKCLKAHNNRWTCYHYLQAISDILGET